MATPPVIGERCSVPPSSSVRREFQEMRRVGVFCSDLVLACLVGFMETKFDREEDFEKQLICDLMPHEPKHANHFYTELTNSREAGFLRSAPARKILMEMAQVITNALDLDFSNELTLRNSVELLCRKLQLGVRMCISTSQFPNLCLANTLVLSEPQRLTICVCDPQNDGRLFVLYPWLSRYSFIELQCGHRTLRSALYVEIERASGDFAVTSNDLETWQTYCRICGAGAPLATYSEALQGADCGLEGTCSHTVAPEERLKCTNCKKFFCRDCAAMRSLCAKGPVCHHCSCSYESELGTILSSPQYSWLQSYHSVALLRGVRDEEAYPNLPQTPPRTVRSGSVETSCKLCAGSVKRTFCKCRSVCMSCLLAQYFKTDSRRCPLTQKCKIEGGLFSRNLDCKKCTKSLPFDEIFLSCGRCGLTVCTKCVKTHPEEFVQCPNSNSRHEVQRKRVVGILKEQAALFDPEARGERCCNT